MTDLDPEQVIERMSRNDGEWPLMDEPGDEWENQLTATMMALSEVYDPAETATYLSTPNPGLGDQRPCDIILVKDLGGLRRLHATVEALADGAYL